MKQTGLEQAVFIDSRARELKSLNQRFLDVWPALTEHQDIPRELAAEEWTGLVDALGACYQSVRLIHKISQLVKAGVINVELLYIMYYKEITDHLTQKLSFLIKWCGTGLDLAADYDSYELARVTEELVAFLKGLNAIHSKHGVDLDREGYTAIVSRFEDRTREFLADPGRFAVDSDNYVDNYIGIKKQPHQTR